METSSGFETLLLSPSDPLITEVISLVTKILRKPVGLSFQERDAKAISDSLLLIATMERISGQIVGCVAMCRNPENESEAQPRLVAVDDSFQGKGIGKMMFKVLEEEAKARGFKSVLINGRIRVTDFYLKLGYQPLSDKVHLSSSVPHKYFRKSLS